MSSVRQDSIRCWAFNLKFPHGTVLSSRIQNRGGELQKKRIIAKSMCVQCAMGHSVAKNVLFWGGSEPGSIHRGEEVSRSLQS